MAKAWITAEELQAQLEADPAYLKRRAERDAQIAARHAALCAEQEPLVADLKAVGWRVESAWDLVNTATPYPEALPVLLDHLRRPYSDRVREGIARALAVPDSRPAWSILLAEYEAAPIDSGVKGGLAAALCVISTPAEIDGLANAVKNRANGSSRILLLSALRKSRSPIAAATLEAVKDDPDLVKEIASWRPRKRKT